MEGDSDSDECTPADISETTPVTSYKLIPEKSKKRYECAYEQFLEWRKKKDIEPTFSEHVLMTYIYDMSKKVKPSTLWPHYSMLRSTIFINDNIDISRYLKLRGLLKRMCAGYKPQKPKILTAKEVNDFIVRAPDEKFLFTKVALVLGISGACRKQELVQLAVDDIDDLRSAAIIRIENTSKVSRRFTITGTFYDVFKKYASLRPDTTERRFFLNYQNGKCTRQVVGSHKMGAVPRIVASFLKLDNPELYTGHTFRRSSSTIPVDGGGDAMTLRRHEVWNPETVKEEYANESHQDVKCE